MRRGSIVFNGRAFIWVMALALLALGLASMATPVFAQGSGVNQNVDQFGLVNDSICSQVYNVAVQQYNAGDQNAEANASAGASAIAGVTATAGATAGADAVAAAVANAIAVNIANVTGIDVGTVNACLNGLAKAPGDGTPGGDTTNGGHTTNGGGTTAADITGENRRVAADVIIDTIPDQKVLADTGGPLLLLLALGLLFVTAGATMLRILLRR
jgi:hypothetical protein